MAFASQSTAARDRLPNLPPRRSQRTLAASILHDRPAYLLAASASLGAIFYGWDIGLIGGVLALPSFRAYFALDTMSGAAQADVSGDIVSVLQGGCL